MKKFEIEFTGSVVLEAENEEEAEEELRNIINDNKNLTGIEGEIFNGILIGEAQEYPDD